MSVERRTAYLLLKVRYPHLVPFAHMIGYWITTAIARVIVNSHSDVSPIVGGIHRFALRSSGVFRRRVGSNAAPKILGCSGV
jgi:hypothetical protein